MKLGIGITTFPWPPEEIGPAVSRIATAADEAGIDSLWVMDHFFQIRLSGLPPESPMPEAYVTLAFLGGLTRRIRLGTLVTSVAYRHPGVLVKTVTALDVLTGGRVIFGVGAGAPWNIAPAGPGTAFEAEGLGIPFPSLAERFERLEEVLQIAHQMWRGDQSPYGLAPLVLGRSHLLGHRVDPARGTRHRAEDDLTSTIVPGAVKAIKARPREDRRRGDWPRSWRLWRAARCSAWRPGSSGPRWRRGRYCKRSGPARPN
jgi:alkanesulfonate monooxygenase SsuD/methylene tetrahydromethanopterin reductase-like flavin-dependent oxidoreductase (luciferase family)